MIKEQIEKKREEMISLANSEGLQSPNVIKLSKELDVLIYQELTTEKGVGCNE
ncbi:MAG: aspartyl-phosphate phosphatase Spo0E family protein [Bacillota bacterium]